jgi:hypothetical protein
MAQDPGQKFDAAVSEALARLRAKVAPLLFEGHNGERVSGWIVQYGEPKESWDGAYLKTTDYSRLILSEAGELWDYAESRTDLQESPYTSTEKNYLWKRSKASSVGNAGAPFSGVIATLSRAGW